MNPFLERNRKIGKVGRLSEKRLSKRLSVRKTPASGATGSKGDLRSAEWMIECKATEKESLSLKREWLDKVMKEALAAGMDPALFISFVNSTGDAKGSEWVCIPLYLWRELCSSSE